MKIRKGDNVMITFDDHVSGGDELIRFVLHGRVADCDHDKVVVDSWHYADDGLARDANCETFTIARRCIHDYVKLIPEVTNVKKEVLWAKYVSSNPVLGTDDGTAKVSAKAVRKMFDVVYDAGFRAGSEAGRSADLFGKLFR